MVEVNLLAWRDKKQAYERKMLTLIMVASLAVAMVLVVLSHLVIGYQINQEKRRVQQIRKILPDEAPQQKISHAMSSGQQAEEYISGGALALFLDNMASVADNGICYQRLMRNENGWQLAGQALSLQSILLAQRMLNARSRLAPMTIRSFKKDMLQDRFQFEMRDVITDNVSGD